jgi:putative ABC transport system ATP-binding protein
MLTEVSSEKERQVLVEARGLRRSFSSDVETIHAVDDVDLDVLAGEFVCIHGASGSGKSTLIGVLAGLDVPERGELTLAGRSVTGLDDTGRAQLRISTVGVVFQDHALIEEFTALENVALPLAVQGMAKQAAELEAREQLARVGMRDLVHRFPGQLSGGQRQRVGIARALVGDRRVLLADEPTGALDSKNSLALFELIRQLCDQGVAAVVCSHDTRCQDYADSVFEMVDGRLHSGFSR